MPNIDHFQTSFPDKQLFSIDVSVTPLYADFVNYLVCGVMPPDLKHHQQKSFSMMSSNTGGKNHICFLDVLIK